MPFPTVAVSEEGEAAMERLSYEQVVNELGVENITSIFATYGNATFRSCILPADVDTVLDKFREAVAEIQKEEKRADARALIRDWVIRTIERNKHMEADTGSRLASALLWLASTSPEPRGSQVLRRAKEGGAIITYEITGGEAGYAHNFRLILDRRPDDPVPPTPKHPLPGLPGGPKLHYNKGL